MMFLFSERVAYLEMDKKLRETVKKIVPYGQQILVFRKKGPEKSKGGVFLSDQTRASGETNICEVLAVGPGKCRPAYGDGMVDAYDPLPVKVGDTIIIGKWAGDPYGAEDADLMFVHIDSVLANIEE